MKIVEINTVNGTGSTGKIAVALYHLANNAGHESYIAYGRGNSPSGVNGHKIGNFFDFGVHVLSNFFLGNSGFASKTVTIRFLNWLDTIQPDILHLHNLHGFYINVELLFKYIKNNNIPVIWTLHDCWPITGQCAHFDYAGCKKWLTQCHTCPIFRSAYPYSLFKDNSYSNYILKKTIFQDVKNMTIVTPSHWLAQIVKKSYLHEYNVQVIPNGIDLDTFKPEQNYTNSKILLGVANVWTPNKGLDFFLELSNQLDAPYQIVLIGVSKKQQKKIQKKYPSILTITRTANQAELAAWYNRALVYINPTLEDTFPTTNLEALACGTPVITFNTGGSPESITPNCGIIVEKGNLGKLREAILSLKTTTEITSSSCRQQAMKYNKDILFREYLKLYEKTQTKY